MSKNAPWARRPSGHTVPSSPAPRTNPSPPRAGMMALPAETFLMLMSVIVLPFFRPGTVCPWFLSVRVCLMPTTLGFSQWGDSELATQRACGVSPTTVSHMARAGEPVGPHTVVFQFESAIQRLAPHDVADGNDGSFYAILSRRWQSWRVYPVT